MTPMRYKHSSIDRCKEMTKLCLITAPTDQRSELTFDKLTLCPVSNHFQFVQIHVAVLGPATMRRGRSWLYLQCFYKTRAPVDFPDKIEFPDSGAQLYLYIRRTLTLFHAAAMTIAALPLRPSEQKKHSSNSRGVIATPEDSTALASASQSTFVKEKQRNMTERTLFGLS
jgi:hypothetical protein